MLYSIFYIILSFVDFVSEGKKDHRDTNESSHERMSQLQLSMLLPGLFVYKDCDPEIAKREMSGEFTNF